MQSLLASVRLVIVSMLVCVVIYTGLILAVAQILTPDSANGSMITRSGGGGDGKIVGSRLIAQKFERPEYFWPRPSAVDYNGAGAGGSNKSPTSEDLTKRAQELIARYGATAENPLPPELAAASGGGLDPHISQHAALYQAPRIAQARGVPQSQIESLITAHAFAPGGFLNPGTPGTSGSAAGDRLVNVLELNLALEQIK